MSMPNPALKLLNFTKNFYKHYPKTFIWLSFNTLMSLLILYILRDYLYKELSHKYANKTNRRFPNSFSKSTMRKILKSKPSDKEIETFIDALLEKNLHMLQYHHYLQAQKGLFIQLLLTKNNITTFWNTIKFTQCLNANPALVMSKILNKNVNDTKKDFKVAIESSMQQQDHLAKSKKFYFAKDNGMATRMFDDPIIEEYYLQMSAYGISQVWGKINDGKFTVSKSYLTDKTQSLQEGLNDKSLVTSKYCTFNQNIAAEQKLRSFGYYLTSNSKKQVERMNAMLQNLTGENNDYTTFIEQMKSNIGLSMLGVHKNNATYYAKFTNLLSSIYQNQINEPNRILIVLFMTFYSYLFNEKQESELEDHIIHSFKTGKMKFYDGSLDQEVEADIDYVSFARCALLSMIMGDDDALSKILTNSQAHYDKKTNKLVVHKIDFGRANLTYPELPKFLTLEQKNGKLQFKHTQQPQVQEEPLGVPMQHGKPEFTVWMYLFEYIPHEAIIEASKDLLKLNEKNLGEYMTKLGNTIKDKDSKSVNASDLSKNLMARVKTVQKLVQPFVTQAQKPIDTLKFTKRAIRQQQQFKNTAHNIGTGNTGGKIYEKESNVMIQVA